MKYFLFSLSLLFFFSACSEFSYVHYRKVKMVPASGSVAPFIRHEKKRSDKRATSVNEKKSDEQINVSDSVFCKTNATLSSEKTKEELKPAPKRIDHKPQSKFIPKKKFIPARSVPSTKKDGVIILVVLFLLFGLALIVSGGIIFVVGIYNLVWWMIALGFVMLFLGLLPFLGFFFGNRSHHTEQYQYEENHRNNN